MITTNNYTLDEEVVQFLALRLRLTPIEIDSTVTGRIFEYPHIPEVYILEDDLTGNRMPEGTCLLAFTDREKLEGVKLKIETLLISTPGDIKRLIQQASRPG